MGISQLLPDGAATLKFCLLSTFLTNLYFTKNLILQCSLATQRTCKYHILGLYASVLRYYTDNIYTRNIVSTKLNGSKKAVQRYKIQYKIGIFLPIKNTKVSFKYIIRSSALLEIRAMLHARNESTGATSHMATRG